MILAARILAPVLILACVACATPQARQSTSRDSSPPAVLQQRIDALGQGFSGHAGIAVEDLGSGWVAGYDSDEILPQQSVSKLWVALTAFDAAEHGRLQLSDPVLVTRGDMSVFHQPIQSRLTDQGYPTTIDGLLELALAESDNAANDILLSRVGGPSAVRRALKARAIGGVRAPPSERELQSRIAAVRWKPEYSFGRAFWTARDAVPMPSRVHALEAYLADPPDGATPRALAHALARLDRGELLGAQMTARFLAILGQTSTGPQRLPAGLPAGWRIAHKTGTGQDLEDLSTGYNDVGLVTAPDGRAYAVVVMIASTRRPVPERQALMAQVAQAVVAAHDASGAPPAAAPDDAAVRVEPGVTGAPHAPAAPPSP
jgi:beta-lactamase class A